MFQAYFDGSFNEKTLCGGAGCVILRDNKLLETCSLPLPDAVSSNESEQTSLRHCLKMLLSHSAKNIQIFGDHLNVIHGLLRVRDKFYSIKEDDNAVRFLRNQEKVNSARLATFMTLEQCFDSYELTAIDGTYNALADSLAAEAAGCLGWAGRQVKPVFRGYVPVPTQVNGGFRYFWRPRSI
jgi:ribonuclease HI